MNHNPRECWCGIDHGIQPLNVAEASLRITAGQPYWCACASRCGDDGDTEGPGTCKGLPRPPREPRVDVVLVPRRPK